jgi:hypothetical protein
VPLNLSQVVTMHLKYSTVSGRSLFDHFNLSQFSYTYPSPGTLTYDLSPFINIIINIIAPDKTAAKKYMQRLNRNLYSHVVYRRQNDETGILPISLFAIKFTLSKQQVLSVTFKIKHNSNQITLNLSISSKYY